MKCGILFSSKTGNTEKIAKAISEEIKDCDLINLKNSPNYNIDLYDLIFAGFWIDKGTADSIAQEHLKNISNKKVAIFTTLGDYPDTEHAKSSLQKGIDCLGENCEIVNTFICQGAVAPELIEWMKKLPPEHPHSPNDTRLTRWEDASTKPDKDDLIKAKEFAKNALKYFR